jgi:hypothetical protein
LTLTLIHSAEFKLERGWNYVSIPIAQRIPIESFLELHAVEISNVWLWNQDLSNGSGGWSVYPRYAGFKSLKEFEPRRGYWILSPNPQTLEVENIVDDPKDFAFALFEGVHAIGFGSGNVAIEPDRFFTLDTQPKILWCWDSENRVWQFWTGDEQIRVRLLKHDYQGFQLLQPGQAYTVSTSEVKLPRMPFMRGPRGKKGATGERGSRGPEGPRGLKGEPGDVITSNAVVENIEITKSITLGQDTVFQLGPNTRSDNPNDKTPSTLALNSLIQLAKQHTEPKACDEQNEATIAMTGVSKLCACDGKEWVYLNTDNECVWDVAATPSPIKWEFVDNSRSRDEPNDPGVVTFGPNYSGFRRGRGNNLGSGSFQVSWAKVPDAEDYQITYPLYQNGRLRQHPRDRYSGTNLSVSVNPGEKVTVSVKARNVLGKSRTPATTTIYFELFDPQQPTLAIANHDYKYSWNQGEQADAYIVSTYGYWDGSNTRYPSKYTSLLNHILSPSYGLKIEEEPLALVFSVQSRKWNFVSYQKFHFHSPFLSKPDDFQVSTEEEGTRVTWRSVPNALFYEVRETISIGDVVTTTRAAASNRTEYFSKYDELGTQHHVLINAVFDEEQKSPPASFAFQLNNETKEVEATSPTSAQNHSPGLTIKRVPWSYKDADSRYGVNGDIIEKFERYRSADYAFEISSDKDQKITAEIHFVDRAGNVIVQHPGQQYNNRDVRFTLRQKELATGIQFVHIYATDGKNGFRKDGTPAQYSKPYIIFVNKTDN